MTISLRDRRVQLRVSQAALAERLGVSQQTIARWETSGQVPAKYLKDLAVCLGARVEDFLPKVAGAPEAAQIDGKEVENEDHDLPFGDVCIQFTGEESPRYYPVTVGTMSRIQQALGDVGVGFFKSAPWFRFEALNNKWVAVNTAQVERVSFTNDNVEAMTSYEHDEVYRAARELCDGLPTAEALEAEDYPYSKQMVADVSKLLTRWGEDSRYEVDGVVCEFTSGFRLKNELNDDVASTLAYMFEAVDVDQLMPSSFLCLSFHEDGTYENVRLGSVRLIEASLQAFSEAAQRSSGE